MEKVIQYTIIGLLAFLTIAILFSLIRAIRGPRRPDRIMGINMIGSFSTMALTALSFLQKEVWLLDVCLVYCMISFLAVVILSKIQISRNLEEKVEETDEEAFYE